MVVDNVLCVLKVPPFSKVPLHAGVYSAWGEYVRGGVVYSLSCNVPDGHTLFRVSKVGKPTCDALCTHCYFLIGAYCMLSSSHIPMLLLIGITK